MNKKYEDSCREYSAELLGVIDRVSGYSPAQVVSVMVVVGVRQDVARHILKTYAEDFNQLDWSEMSWGEMREEFAAILGDVTTVFGRN